MSFYFGMGSVRRQISFGKIKHLGLIQDILVVFFVAIIPLFIAFAAMNLWHWDISIPLDYREKNSDETWQLILTKMVTDGGWVLDNNFLGAPSIAHWHNNSAAQTSLLHSIVMLCISKFVDGAVAVQQIYYLLSFSLISVCTYFSCRLLGILRFLSFLIAIMCSLLSYKFNYVAYAFLPNYYMVPLALVVVVWVLSGEFASNFPTRKEFQLIVIKGLFLSKKFLLGVLFIFLITISDGYYAFFTLLLLGFSIFVRILLGDFRRSINLYVPIIYVAILLLTAYIISLPISTYKNSNKEEFFPNGVQDPALVRHAFEAEIYALSVKLLIAPSVKHRVKSLADLGKGIVATSDAVRIYKTQLVYVPLGILGSVLLLFALSYIVVPKFPWGGGGITFVIEDLKGEPGKVWILSVLSLYILLFSIEGGLGSLVALVFPTIRAYDRFPLFLIFSLYFGFGCFVTYWLKRVKSNIRLFLIAGLVFVSALSIYDQLPNDVEKGSDSTKSRFLAEKKFVSHIESLLPSGAMVYQYPYSQWLIDSPYYGWGSFAHVRLYLHSVSLRWSNGASKNSPVDNWHMKIASLPIDQLLNEVAYAGFSAVVVDRRVVSLSEYERVLKALLPRIEGDIINDDDSRLAFFKLKPPIFRLTYDESYLNANKIEIYKNRGELEGVSSRMINSSVLKALVSQRSPNENIIFEKSTVPSLFYSATEIGRNEGFQKLEPLSDVRGNIDCKSMGKVISSSNYKSFEINVSNQSNFDWMFGHGPYPLNIGFHVKDFAGKMLLWDNGFRLPMATESIMYGNVLKAGSVVLKSGESRRFIFTPSQFDMQQLLGQNDAVNIEFRLVQDGNAWFDGIGCDIHVVR